MLFRIHDSAALWLFAWLSSSLLFRSTTFFFCRALYAEDAGVLDFTVATTGHGAVGWVHSYKDTVVTTDTLSSSWSSSSVNQKKKGKTSCYVASRRQQKGKQHQEMNGILVWRRNVCSVPSDHQAHAIAAMEDVFFTADHTGVVRGWTLDDASLLWDAHLDSPNRVPKLWAIAGRSSQNLVAVASQQDLVLLDAGTGTVLHKVNALQAMHGNVRKGQTVQWLALALTSRSTLKVVFAHVDADGVIQSGNDVYTAELDIGTDQVKAVKAWNKGKHILADSVTLQLVAENKWHVMAVSKSGSAVVDVSVDDSSISEEIVVSKLHPKWTSVVAIEATSEPSVVRMSGKTTQDSEATMALFRFDGASVWERLYGLKDSPEIEFSSTAYCPTAGVVVTTGSDALVVYRHDSLNEASASSATVGIHERLSPLTTLTVKGDMVVPDGDTVSTISVLECAANKVTVMLSTERGSTTQLSFEVQGAGSIDVKVDWTAEEGLSSLSSVVFVDASHLGFDDLVEEQDVVASKLSLSGRLASQWQNTLNLLSASGIIDAVSHSNRDHIFGFVKVAALLSPSLHRIWGMDTAGDRRGSVRWTLDLPKSAVWHSMVHGTTNSATAVHGINGDTHSREILVLSATPNGIHWMCIDGTNGAVNAEASVPTSSPIVQVVPIYGASTGGCRQAALLLHDDLNITVIPADPETNELAMKQLHKTPNGLYTHKIDKVSNQMQSYQVALAVESDKLVARSVGSTSFAGEQIVKVVYPIRHEEIQSMSTILGDDSLLLKYINPHMVVIVTVLKDDDDQSTTELASVVEKKTNKQPRKPAGVGTPETSPELSEPLPNMFVNLVDTVSGRVLYRASHTGVDKTKDVSAVITENWVIYSYVNQKTRRTEVGVLTLHEGMIDSKGLTFFAKPEQVTSFSSFDARESTPVVLAKTYAFSKQITALGVTSTRQGIGSQNILVASSDGALNSFLRKIFETRRPVGEVKPDEKKEGLIPYRELIPDSPLLSLTYNQTTEPFTRIVSAETSLESQSLVLGYGGPDLFFTRTSPTKGFDLLPETFNKVLVGIVTVGIVVAVLVVQRMGDKKALQQSWL
ncbi:DUF1620 domain containing protein [Nitzschia inconspicua]|uniref:ER membrane protein complex subunit 1 n=1 Tax=Nitzschia inconspicua TaxID=303405 RepID=A0A9K3PDK8_9STRA|nr:DUF1620 domain containing protein [Nitzschia inconspicua]